jgi:hypothetical protein
MVIQKTIKTATSASLPQILASASVNLICIGLIINFSCDNKKLLDGAFYREMPFVCQVIFTETVRFYR